MAAQIVIAVYRPKAGQEQALAKLIAGHVPLLREQGLATDRPVTVMRSFGDGTFLEVFEWVSQDAARTAHENPAVKETWDAMGEVADFVTLSDLPEAPHTFPHFEPV